MHLRERDRAVLITGANGFIGRNLCKFLVARNWRVVAATRQADAISGLGVQVERLSLLEEPERWQHALRSVNHVIHLAARVHALRRGDDDAELFNTINVSGTAFVVQQAIAARVKRLVLMSSVKVNGEGGVGVIYRAEDVPQPQGAYAKSKLMAEIVTRNECARAGVQYVIVRPPLVYGPEVKANLRRLLRLVELGVPLPFRSIDNCRSLVGIENVVDFIQTCMIHPLAAGKVWFVSDGDDLSTPELIRKLARAFARNPRLFSFSPYLLQAIARVLGLGDEMQRLCDSLRVDITPARTLLQWNPAVTAEMGLARAVQAYLSTRTC